MAPIWTKNGPFWTNMAQGIPGNSHSYRFVICIINLSILAVEFLHSTVVLREGSGGGFLVLRHCNWVP